LRPLIAVIGQRCTTVPILRFSATLAAEAICEGVYAAGGEPSILHGPADGPGDEFATRLERFDGVLMPGGADIDPARYGQQATADEIYGIVEFQDDLDLAVAQVVLSSGLPTFAICRGMQVINVALGGTLTQHLPTTPIKHMGTVHEVAIDLGSRLHDVLGSDTVPVSSYHHQGVDSLGEGLSVVGRAPDGVIEAVEHPTADLIAVQWHPEDLHKTSPTDAALFSDLVARAAASQRSLAR
jgi:putative glutamine amidotransferase